MNSCISLQLSFCKDSFGINTWRLICHKINKPNHTSSSSSSSSSSSAAAAAAAPTFSLRFTFYINCYIYLLIPFPSIEFHGFYRKSSFLSPWFFPHFLFQETFFYFLFFAVFSLTTCFYHYHQYCGWSLWGLTVPNWLHTFLNWNLFLQHWHFFSLFFSHISFLLVIIFSVLASHSQTSRIFSLTIFFICFIFGFILSFISMCVCVCVCVCVSFLFYVFTSSDHIFSCVSAINIVFSLVWWASKCFCFVNQQIIQYRYVCGWGRVWKNKIVTPWICVSIKYTGNIAESQ